MFTALPFDSCYVAAITEDSFLVRVGNDLVKIHFSEIPADHPVIRCEKLAIIIKAGQ